MALRKIALQGEPCLTKVCRPVTDFNGRLHTLLDDLADTRGTCVAALANLRGGLAAHDPARLVLAAEALSAVSLLGVIGCGAFARRKRRTPATV